MTIADIEVRFSNVVSHVLMGRDEDESRGETISAKRVQYRESRSGVVSLKDC